MGSAIFSMTNDNLPIPPRGPIAARIPIAMSPMGRRQATALPGKSGTLLEAVKDV